MSIARKTIKGRQYLYFESSADGKKRSIYCGPSDRPSSWEKAKMLEETYIYGSLQRVHLAPLSWELYPSFNRTNRVYNPNDEVELSTKLRNKSNAHIHVSGVMVKTDWMKGWHGYDNLDVLLPPEQAKPLPNISFKIPIDVALEPHLCLIGLKLKAFRSGAGWVDYGIVPVSEPYFIEIQQPPLKNFSIFVSHSTEDLSLVSTLSDWLKRCGISAYISEFNPQYGEKLSDKVARAIDLSDCVMAILTRAGARSCWVSWEIGYARKAGKPVIPVVELGTDIKPFVPLADLEYITLDRSNPYGAIIEAVSLATKKLGEKQRNAALGILALLFLIGLFGGGLATSKS